MGKRLFKGTGFSLNRLTGVSAAKSKISRAIGVPLTKTGRQAKVGRTILSIFKTGK
jgi:hypothetical protein